MARKDSQPTMQQDLLTIRNQVQLAQGKREKMAHASARQRLALMGAVVIAGFILVFLAIDTFGQAKEGDTVVIADFLAVTQYWSAATRTYYQAHLQQPVANGDMVLTNSTGSAHLEFPDGSLVKIGQASSFTVAYTAYDNKTGARNRSLELNTGRLWARVTKFTTRDSSFNITTPAVIAGVHGTRFSVLVYPGGHGMPRGATRVSVYEGEVSVMDRTSHRSVMLQAGQETLAFPRSGATPPIMTMSAPETAEWNKQKNDGSGVFGSSSHPFRVWLTGLEQKFMARPLAAMDNVIHLPDPNLSYQNGTLGGATAATNRTLAINAGHQIQAALDAVYDPGSGYPAQIGLTDLSGLNFDPDKVPKILAQIAGNALVSYQRTGGSYELYLRAKPPSNVLIKVTPEGVNSVGNGG